VNYQFCGVNGFTEEQNTIFITKLHEIIDQHKIAVQAKSNDEQKTLGILLARIDRRTMEPTIKEYDESHYIVELNPQLSPELREHSEQATKQYENTFKYTSLRLWSDFIHNKNHPNSSPIYKQYDDSPLFALEETKQLIKELNNERQNLLPMDNRIPAFVCSKLMIEHKDKLSKDDMDFCKEITIPSVSLLFSDEYNYQVCDGVEAAIHAIPHLIIEYSEIKNDLLLMLVSVLFFDRKVGNKRICDYVIESIHESKLWELDSNIAQTILLGYIKLKPIYNKIHNEKRKEQNTWGRISKSAILKDFERNLGSFSFTNLSYNIQDVTSLDIEDLEIIYQLIPSNTCDTTHLEIYKNTLPIIIPQLLKNRNQRHKEHTIASHIYSLQLRIAKRFAHFILERNLNEIDNYLRPFIDSFDATEETATFLDEIISAEDYNNKYEQFWYVWKKLYPKFIEVCKNSHGFHLSKVVRSYLLAWQRWREGIIEWHSLKKENLSLYINVATDIGNNPTVLYSISKVLNSIGSNFLDDGISWIHTIVSENKSLELRDLESDTLYYLEKLMRKFIFINKEKIKRELKLRNKIIFILEFMIERGSVRGYLLRESIL
jgi:hypothetical protein